MFEFGKRKAEKEEGESGSGEHGMKELKLRRRDGRKKKATGEVEVVKERDRRGLEGWEQDRDHCGDHGSGSWVRIMGRNYYLTSLSKIKVKYLHHDSTKNANCLLA